MRLRHPSLQPSQLTQSRADAARGMLDEYKLADDEFIVAEAARVRPRSLAVRSAEAELIASTQQLRTKVERTLQDLVKMIPPANEGERMEVDSPAS